jgi:hypothetical protein
MSRIRWYALAVICMGVLVSSIPVYSIWLQMRAKALIRNASVLYQYPGNAPTITTVQALYKGRLIQKQGCTPAYCGYEVIVSNGTLTALHWSSYSELRSEIWFQNGILKTTILDYTSSANPHHSIVSHVYIQDGPGAEFDLDPWEKSSPADTNGIVTVSPQSLRTHEQTVLGFDIGCFTSHRGCISVAEMLPTVWEQVRDGSIRCRLPNHKGLIEGPKWLWDALQ